MSLSDNQILQMSFNRAGSMANQSVPNIKNPQITKGAKMKDNPNEDIKTLKESCDIIDF